VCVCLSVCVCVCACVCSSAFFVFCSEYRPSVKQQTPGLSIGDCAKKLGEMWGKLTQSDKVPHEEKAQKFREKYDRVSTGGGGVSVSVCVCVCQCVCVSVCVCLCQCVCLSVCSGGSSLNTLFSRTWWRTAAVEQRTPGTPDLQLREETKRRMTRQRTRTTMMTSRGVQLDERGVCVCVCVFQKVT